ncbi:hypothetical protein ncot_15560 [Nocardioides sp. JQ2195]|uniref:hypothetical protein n=1 Tax=Nocardioides sp. JQ2195 TaxID=2592334 RepID=UPI00143E1762|nr:hypothetical protein [Nocardioides sp. JQ2195]QIX27847.1 hypothetical protein ncot_15560 [Nocardioides sp. JQ2195]
MTSPATTRAPVRSRARLDAIDPAGAALVRQLLALAPTGLAAGHDPATGGFAQTVRGLSGTPGTRLQRQGDNLRYAAMAALGLARVPVEQQRQVLAGGTAAELAARTAERAVDHRDPGAVALAAWARAEVNGAFAGELFDALDGRLGAGVALPTVDASWAVTAATVAAGLGDTSRILHLGTRLLLDHRGTGGIFPHWLPPTAQPRWRGHVGCFADQVYPIQALARVAALTGRGDCLAAANRTASRICELQGEHGQWWWHYDIRNGGVVEKFPVYSVHQHAMGPMALFDLLEAGGDDHTAAVARGLAWLQTHPEVVEELVSPRFGVIWRKVGRREPPKAARAVNTATTAVRVGAHLPGIDRLLPPTSVDHECRPYELGWLLHAWLPPTPSTEMSAR